MMVDLIQEEIDLLKVLLDYLDYLGYSQTDDEALLVASIQGKLGDT